MGRIWWNTDVNAPGCRGAIESEEGGSILVQTDWDWPGVASTFGWNIRDVQVMNRGYYGLRPCDHSGTDGTVDCPDCGLTAGTFIAYAGEYLDEDHGPVEDPGYFSEG